VTSPAVNHLSPVGRCGWVQRINEISLSTHTDYIVSCTAHSIADDAGKTDATLASSSIQPFGHNRHGPKIGGSDPFLLGGKSPGPRPTSIASGILIHPAVWAQETWAENWGGCAPFPINLGPHLTQRGQGRGHAKFHLDPSNRLATVHERYRQTGQRSDSIGQANRFTNGRPKR